MAITWLKLDESDETETFAVDFWRKHRADTSKGAFWADEIKKYKDEPEKRLSLALENLPLPAAFRESMVALRKIISDRKKAGESFYSDLALLYRLGAVESMMLPYAEKLQEPGFNVMESIPGGLLLRLAEPYQELGYAEMSLFNKSDRNAFDEAWGAPETHTTMNKKYREIWNRYEARIVNARGRSRGAI